jgi:prephenate dehydratase
VHPDTAGAAKMISQSKESGAGAICSTLAAQMYGLHILDEDIQDSANNITRFILLTQKKSSIRYSEKQHKTSIICTPNNLEFALYSCLGVFAKRNIPITKIESLPNPENPFSYMFLIDFIDKTQQDKQEEVLAELSNYAKHIRVLGTY